MVFRIGDGFLAVQVVIGEGCGVAQIVGDRGHIPYLVENRGRRIPEWIRGRDRTVEIVVYSGGCVIVRRQSRSYIKMK